MAATRFADGPSAQAFRYLFRDIDWAPQQNLERWLTAESRSQCSRELAEAKVAHKSVRRFKATMERTSATTAYHDLDSTASLYCGLMTELKRTAIDLRESQDCSDINVWTLTEKGSQIAPSSCTAHAGYSREEEVDNIERAFAARGLDGTQRDRATFSIPLLTLRGGSLTQAASADDDEADSLNESTTVTLTAAQVKARQSREAQKPRLRIGEDLENNLPADSTPVNFWSVVADIAANVKVYYFKADTQKRVQRNEEQINAFMRRMVEVWNNNTDQRPPATVEDLIRVGSRGDIVKLLDEHPSTNPVRLVMRRAPPPPEWIHCRWHQQRERRGR